MDFASFLPKADKNSIKDEGSILSSFERAASEEEDYIQLLQLRYLLSIEPFVTNLNNIIDKIRNLPNDAERSKALPKIAEYIYNVSNKFETNKISSHIYAFFLTSFISKLGIPQDKINWIDPRRYDLIDFSFSNNPPMLGYGGYQENRSNFPDISGKLPFIKVDEKVITVPYGIKEIQKTAFDASQNKRKTKVEFVTLPSSVIRIEEGAFARLSSLKYIVLPSSIKVIPQGMFLGCTSLKEVVAYGVTEIAPGAFSGSSIESLRGFNIKGLEKVQGGAFANCTKLTSVITPYTCYSAVFGGCTSLKELAYKAHPKVGMMKYLFMANASDLNPKCNVEKVAVNFADGVIPRGYFQDMTSLKEIDIIGNISSIGEGAFANCTNLKKINIKFIGNIIPPNAFKGCKNLVSIPELKNVDTVLDNAFDGVESLETLFLSPKLINVGRYAFKDSKSLKNINFEYDGEVLPTGAFNDVIGIDISKLLPNIKIFEPYSASGIIIPEGFSFSNDVKYIGSNAFLGAKFPEKFILNLSPNTAYEMEAFKDTNIKALFYNTLKIKDSTGAEIDLYKLFTTSIDEFKRKYQIESAVINVTEIPENGFKDWECLTFVGLAENTKVIGKRAFANCKNLKVIKNKAKGVSIEEEAFLGCSNLAYITINNNPIEGEIDLNFASKIAPGAFSGCDKFNIIKAKDVDLVYPTAFFGCSNIQSIEVRINKLFSSQGHKFITLFAKDLDIFNDRNKDLKEINIKFEDNQIPSSFFEGLENITSIIIDGDIKLIEEKAFKDLPNLENLSLNYIGEIMPSYIFSGTPKINPLDYAKNVTIYEPYSLSNLEFPSGYKLSSNLKRVMSHAFENSKFDEMFILTFVNGATFEPLSFKGTNVSNLSLSSFEVKNSDGNSLELYQIFEDSFEEFENNYLFSRVLIDAKEIPANAFKGWKNLQKVVCSESVKKIGDSAFEGCESIEAIKFKGNDVVVGDRAFNNCQNLKSFVTDNDTEENVINLDFTKSIGKEAFANCPSFTNIVAREVDYIDRLVFANSVNITEVHLKISDKYLNSGYKFYEIFTDSIEDFNTRFEKVDYIEVIVNNHISESFFENLTSIYEITITGDLSSIGKNCFRKAFNVENIYFKFNGEEIFEGTFEGLDRIEVLPNMPNVSIIGDNAFKNCDNLREIHLSDKIIKIGKSAFKNCQKLASISSEIFATKIEEETFYGCEGLCYIDLTNINEVGDRAFEGVECITEITTGQIEGTIKDIFPNSHIKRATYIGKRIPARFYADLEELEEVSFNGIISIGAFAFDGCKSLKQISDISKVNYIGDNAFSGTALEEIIIPKDIEFFGNYLFENCSNLTRVSVPLIDKKIADLFSLENYESAKEVKTFEGEEEYSYFIPNTLSNIEITRFENAGNFSGLDVDISLIDELEDIPENFLKNYMGNINLNLEKVKHIGNYAFAGQEMNSIELPNIETIDKYAFNDVKGLSNLSFGSSVKELPKEIFIGPELLKVEIIDNDRYEMSEGLLYDKKEKEILFVNKDAYGDIHIKEYVNIIEDNVFTNCNLINKIYTSNVNEIKDNAFKGLEDLTDLYIENPNCKVGEDILVGSNKLINLTIPSLEINGTSLSLDYYLEKCDITHKINLCVLKGKVVSGFLGKITSINKLDLSSTDLKELPNGLFKELEIDELYLPNDIDRISEKAFDNTKINKIYSDSLDLEDGIIYLKDILIYVLKEKYDSLVIKEGTSLIYSNAFEQTKSISSLDLSKVSDIALNRVFTNYEIKELITNDINLDNEFTALNDSLKKLIYLGESFDYSLSELHALKEIEFTNVKELDKNSLAITGEVDEIRLPNINVIKDYVFGNYDPTNNYIKLKTLVIGNNVKEIGQNALYNAYIKKLNIQDNDKYKMFRGALIDIENKEILFVEKDSPTSFEYIEELNNIHSYAFFGAKNLTNIVIKNVKNIGDRAFSYLDKLEKVIIGKPLETLGEGVFYNSKLDTLQIPFVGYQIDKPEQINQYLFSGCNHNLKHLYLSAQKAFVPNNFSSLELETLILSNEIESFNDNIFAGLSIDHFVVPYNVKKLKSLTFMGMKNNHQKKIDIYVPSDTYIEDNKLIIRKIILFATKANIIKNDEYYQKQYINDIQIRGFYENE